jgi:hypothetical protein
MAPKKKQKQDISVPGLIIERATIEIRGLTPLITNAWSEEAIEAVERGGVSATAKEQRAAQSVEERRQGKYSGAFYYTKDLKPGIPASAVKNAIVSAGFRFAKEKSTVLKGVFSIVGGDILEIKGSEPKMRRDVVKPPGAMGGTSIAYRPQWDVWSLQFDVKYLAHENGITIDKLLFLINTAGMAVGIGAWRPEKDGTFGTFEAHSVGGES